MKYTDLTYRELTLDDLESFIELCNKHNSVMNIKISNDYTPPVEIEQIRRTFIPGALPGTVKRMGAFYNNVLVGSAAGYFVADVSSWYIFGIYVDASRLTAGLSLFSEVHHLLVVLLNDLILYGEASGHYSFYLRFSLTQRNSFDKSFQRLIRKNIQIDNGNNNYRVLQYDPYCEMVYKAGTRCRFGNHQFYFRSQSSFPIDTIVTLHSLKQSERKILLNVP